jgi:ABC-2 type transport system permease protein
MLRGLLLKDLLILKRGILIGLAMFIFYGILGKEFNDASFLAGYFILFFTLISISSYAYDEQAKWTPYALTITMNRTKLVQSKYLLSLIMVIMGFLCSLLITIPQLISKPGTFVLTISPIIWGALYISLLINFILIPIIFKLGSENSRMIMLAICIIPSIIVFLLGKKNLLPTLSKEQIETIIKIAPYIGVISIVLFGVLSYYISLKIVKKKDF